MGIHSLAAKAQEFAMPVMRYIVIFGMSIVQCPLPFCSLLAHRVTLLCGCKCRKDVANCLCAESCTVFWGQSQDRIPLKRWCPCGNCLAADPPIFRFFWARKAPNAHCW